MSINQKNIPISLKIALIFSILGIFLLTILFVLILPKIEEKKYENAKKQIEQVVLLTNNQIALVANYLNSFSFNKGEKLKTELKHSIERINLDSNIKDKFKNLKKLLKNYNCELNTNTNLGENYSYFNWHKIKLNNPVIMCPHPTHYLLYKTKIDNNKINITCKSKLDKSTYDLENDIKKIVQEGFALTKNIHKGKIYLMWINKDLQNNSEKLISIDNLNNKNYCISKISNITEPLTGDLTTQELLNVKKINFFEHKLNNKETFTWVSKINENELSNFVLIFSAYKSDFEDYFKDDFLNIIPIAILALFLSIVLTFIIFYKWLKKIDILSKTAKEINNGNLKVRSNIQGNDDLSILGKTFDLMLDNLEDNIKNLDLKIKQRTNELENSLKSKEILLQELNHRVKNNLFLIINFIKLQKNKTGNADIKDSLQKIENRIYSISLVHSKLFQVENFESITSKEYFTQLIEDLKKSFDNEKDLFIISNIENHALSIETSMYCGILLNELITNSIKYGLINNTKIIYIDFYLYKKYFIFKISDNGEGLQKDFNINKNSNLGLKLVDTIVKNQLKGDLNIQNYPLEIIIKFPI